MLTEAQIRWATLHDWCLGRVGNTVEVVDHYTDRKGVFHWRRFVWKKSFEDLRDWAGY